MPIFCPAPSREVFGLRMRHGRDVRHEQTVPHAKSKNFAGNGVLTRPVLDRSSPVRSLVQGMPPFRSSVQAGPVRSCTDAHP